MTGDDENPPENRPNLHVISGGAPPRSPSPKPNPQGHGPTHAQPSTIDLIAMLEQRLTWARQGRITGCVFIVILDTGEAHAGATINGCKAGELVGEVDIMHHQLRDLALAMRNTGRPPPTKG